jgi:hypothetical protein
MFKTPQVEGHWHTTFEGFSTSALDFYELVKAGIARREIPDLKISQVEWKESGLGSGKRVYLRVSREGLNFDICAAPFGTGYFFSWWLAVIPQVLLDFVVLLCIAALGVTTLGIGSYLVLMGLGLSAQGSSFGGLLLPLGFCLGPGLFFGVVFGMGFLIRYKETSLEPAVLSMPITGLLYGFFFRPVTYFNEDTAIMFRESVHHAVLEAIDQVTTAQGVRGLTEDARKITFEPGGKRT